MKINYSDNFLDEAKKLSKKYKLIKQDLQIATKEISQQNDLGVYLGLNLFKKRVRNSSIPIGKSGGFRMIIYKQIQDEIVLLSIYSKTQKESLSDNELKEVINKFIK